MRKGKSKPNAIVDRVLQFLVSVFTAPCSGFEILFGLVPLDNPTTQCVETLQMDHDGVPERAETLEPEPVPKRRVFYYGHRNAKHSPLTRSVRATAKVRTLFGIRPSPKTVWCPASASFIFRPWNTMHIRVPQPEVLMPQSGGEANPNPYTVSPCKPCIIR